MINQQTVKILDEKIKFVRIPSKPEQIIAWQVFRVMERRNEWIGTVAKFYNQFYIQRFGYRNHRVTYWLGFHNRWSVPPPAVGQTREDVVKRLLKDE
jgi:hypothetical protein